MPKTLGDKIRSMTDEQLAEYLTNEVMQAKIKFGFSRTVTIRDKAEHEMFRLSYLKRLRQPTEDTPDG